MKLKNMLEVIQEYQIIEITYSLSHTPLFHGEAKDALKLNKYVMKADVLFCKTYTTSVLSIVIK